MIAHIMSRGYRRDDEMTTAHTYLLAAEHLYFDLDAAGTELHGMVDEGQDRRGVTLVKQGGMSVVLSHLHAGGSLAEHAAPGPATVQVLTGHVRMQVGDDTLDVKRGHLVAFDAQVRHSVEAIKDSTLLLTISDPRN